MIADWPRAERDRGRWCFRPSTGCPRGQGLLFGGGAGASTKAPSQREQRVGGPAWPIWHFPGERGALLWSFRETHTLVSAVMVSRGQYGFLGSQHFLLLGQSAPPHHSSRGGPGGPWASEMPQGCDASPGRAGLRAPSSHAQPYCSPTDSQLGAELRASRSLWPPWAASGSGPAVPFSASLHGQLFHPP